MKRRYLGLLAATVATGVAMSLWGGPGRIRNDTESAHEIVDPVAEVALRIGPYGGVDPQSVSVEKGTRVALTVTNAGSARVRVELPGYEDRLPGLRLEPGAIWRGTFVADRPGEDFAWMVDGKPAGRFAVTGSHLIEGHR